MTELATFAAGCFWGVEVKFRMIPGVVDAAVGYSNGRTENPTYKDVCTDETGHAEVVQVTFDPEKVSYESVLAHARSDASKSSGTGFRHAVSHGDFHALAGTGSHRKEVQSRSRGQQEISTPDCHGNHPCRQILSRGRISPTLPREARHGELPYLGQVR